MPYERELIPTYDEIINEIDKTIQNKEIIEQVAHSNKSDVNPIRMALYEDPFLKYKEHEREQRRERRLKNIEKEKEAKYKKKIEDWLIREQNREKDKEREL